jgi:hypothetical protein
MGFGLRRPKFEHFFAVTAADRTPMPAIRCLGVGEAPADARLLVHVLRVVAMAAWTSGRMPRRVPLYVWVGRLRL